MFISDENIPSDLLLEVKKHLLKDQEAKAAVVREKQLKVATARRNAEAVTIDGIGQHVMTLTAEAFFSWGQYLTFDCWADPDFRRLIMRDNPEVRVKYAPRTASIIHPGIPGRDS